MCLTTLCFVSVTNKKIFKYKLVYSNKGNFSVFVASDNNMIIEWPNNYMQTKLYKGVDTEKLKE